MMESLEAWAAIAGADHPDRCWLLHPCDAWVRNPHYQGEPTPHPEDDE